MVRAGGAPSATGRSILRLADVLGFPSRLLSAMHIGDVRMHITWAVAGSVLLCLGMGRIPWPDVPPLIESTAPPAGAAAADHVDIVAAWPQMILVAAAVIALLLKAAVRGRAFVPALVLTLAAMVGAAVVLIRLYDPLPAGWHDMMGLMRLDPLAVLAQLALLAVSALAVLASLFGMRRLADRRADFLVVLLLELAGAAVAVAATDMLTLYTGLALMAISNVILMGMQAGDTSATEAAMKYFLVTMAAFGLLLFGMALLYAAVGDTQYDGVAEGLSQLIAMQAGPTGLASAGLGLILAGMAMLIGLAPMHMHVPDTYQGAPAAAAAFAVSVPTIASVFVLVRMLMGPFAVVADLTRPMVLLVAIVSLAGGALTGAAQTDPRRTLGYLATALSGAVMALVAGVGLNAPGQGLEHVHEALAMALVLAVALPAAGGVATAALCGTDLASPSEDVGGVMRRTVASGPVFVLAMACLVLAAVLLHTGGTARLVNMPPIAKAIVVGALVVAAARLTALFWRLSQKPATPVPFSARIAGGAISLALVAMAVGGALCAGHVIHAVMAMWPQAEIAW
jgi:NADH-quinone oxidoreductase subunit N